MLFSELFGEARWVKGDSTYPLMRAEFRLDSLPQKAQLRICGLGFFHAWLNGVPVGKDEFMPLYTDYHRREGYPAGEELGYRTLVPEFSVEKLLRRGNNYLCVSLGPGYYRYGYKPRFGDEPFYGDVKLAFCLLADGEPAAVSLPETVRWKPSHIVQGNLIFGEEHDLNLLDEHWREPEYDASDWADTVPAKEEDTDYRIQQGVGDRQKSFLKPTTVKTCADYTVYDFGCNTTGKLVVESEAQDTVRVLFSEALTPDGELDPVHAHYQYNTYHNDGTERQMEPEFTWNSFRYASVTNNARPLGVRVIVADVAVFSGFESSDNTLNWLYKTYLNTQLTNMHCGIPTDCPHFERRGYTGDGQLTAQTCMLCLDARQFYEKWMEDIALCQDRKSGHVQYTAPYVHSGGGPGGWGCAIVHIPYVMWKLYGDKEIPARYFDQMLHYFSYLEQHSSCGLVVTDKEGDWCLGDWCTAGPLKLPEPFVNTWFMIRSLEEASQMAMMLGRDEDAARLKNDAQQHRQALNDHYFEPANGNFCCGMPENPFRRENMIRFMDTENGAPDGNEQAANAFGLLAGLGDERTKRNLLERMRTTDGFDSGIFGTDVLLDWLFRNGYGEEALQKMTSHGTYSYGHWMDQGATTLWEYWYGKRSYNHPMFGAPVRFLFTQILGIRQKTEGFRDIVIEPAPTSLTYAGGFLRTVAGEITVRFTREENTVSFEVDVPQDADFLWKGKLRRLKKGKNCFRVEA